MTKRVEFFWDAASPYTYLASTQIETVTADCDVEIDWRPLVLGGIFQATGNQPPINIPAKEHYLYKDIRDWARFYDVPLTIPENFPARSLEADRAGLIAAELGHGQSFAKHVLHTHWGEGRDISDAQVLADIARDCGLDAAHIGGRLGEQIIKDQLKANTEEAASRGAFGAPTFFVDDVMFWGTDHLPLLRAHLQGRI